jgi:hypothetical protein
VIVAVFASTDQPKWAGEYSAALKRFMGASRTGHLNVM